MQQQQQPDGSLSDFAAVDAITRAAESYGWRSRDAFFLAMMLHIEGVSVAEAEKMFAQAARRRVQ
jgi:hypothetical protein